MAKILTYVELDKNNVIINVTNMEKDLGDLDPNWKKLKNPDVAGIGWVYDKATKMGVTPPVPKVTLTPMQIVDNPALDLRDRFEALLELVKPLL